MNIEDALVDIARNFGFDEQQLITSCYEDTVGGWDRDAGRWPVGSVWSVEGRILYAITRALKPDFVLEVGTHHGCSATHFAEAVKANGKGHVIGVDPSGAAGNMIPANLRQYVQIVNTRWQDMDGLFPAGVGIVFEDADHSAETTADVWRAAAERLPAGSVIASHDAMHFLVGAAIREGIARSGVMGVRFYPVQMGPTPSQDMCGLAVWRKPGWGEAVLLKNVYEAVEKSYESREEAEKIHILEPKRKAGRPKKVKSA